MLKVEAASLPEVKLITPPIFKDHRGLFLESYQKDKLAEFAGIDETFVQDNFSRSHFHVLRGLHYQINRPQGKLVMVLRGAVFDVAVDLRKNSATFGKWVGMHLNGDDPQLLWIPPGFAHGFLALSESVDFLYKATDFYDPTSEYCLRWDDPDLAIDWPLKGVPVMSEKDRNGKFLKDCRVYP